MLTTAPEGARTRYEQVVVVAPTQRDAEVTCSFLAAANVDCISRCNPADVEALVREGIGALILTDITLARPGAEALLRAVREQPPWSDLPVLLLTPVALPAGAVLDALRNVTVLDRPTSQRAMVSAVKAALRGRRWQYQIRDQIDELTRAEQHKDAFLATLAHELRNPLAPIRAGVQLLRHAADPHGKVEPVRAMIERQIGQLVKLIDQLLDISRISTGKVVLQREPVDLRSVLRVAVEGSQPALDAAGHRFEMELTRAPVVVVGDATRLAQSVGNLINNAAKYTPRGGRIALTLHADAGEAQVRVRDDGMGIPADMLDRVFDMFTQVDRTLERSQGGLGIGLSLVKSLVDLHGGRVEAASGGHDRGSTFTIHLPLAEPAALRGANDTDAATADRPATRPVRVLVVDDNRDAADSMAMLLQAIGHETAVRYDAASALMAAASFLPQAVLCDLGMPGMGGFELAAQMRRDPRFDATLLVAVTGWGTEEDKRRSLRAGFDAHLTKPASSEHLEALLARC